MRRAIVWGAVAGATLMASAWMVGTSTPRPPDPALSAVASAADSRLRLPSRPGALRIEGEVIGVAPGETGTLTLRVGGAVQQQVGTTAGAFTIVLPEGPGSAMVSLEYTQAGVHFTSLLGSRARLLRIAGTDNRLTLEDCECTRVSAFSTGLQHMATTLLGHAPRSDVELRNVVRRMGSDLTSATVALARLADSPDLLPPGHDTGLALLQDPSAFWTYLEQTHHALLLEDPAAALAPIPAADITDADVPARIAFLGPMLDVRSPLAVYASVLEREGDAFTLHGGFSDLGNTYTGAVQDGRLVLTPSVEIAYTNLAQVWCPSTLEMTGERWKLLRQEMRRRWTGDRLQIWETTTESEISYPECPELPGSIQRTTGISAAADLADTGLLTSARRFQGRTALPVFCDTSDQHNGSSIVGCSYDVHEFASDGTGTIVDLGDKVGSGLAPIQSSGRRPFSWAMGDDGAMHVQAGEERVRYWVLDGGDGAALGVVHIADADRGAGRVSIAGYTAMIRAGVPDTYTASSAVGAWGYGTRDFSSRWYLVRPFSSRVRIVRDASGQSVEWVNDAPAPVDPERWTTAWGRLYSTRWSGADCTQPSAQCWRSSVRYFRPLARVGNRIHGIEEYYVKAGGEGPGHEAALAQSRPQFHEARPLPTAGHAAVRSPASAGKAESRMRR